jgi:hypothetical protein
LPKLQETLTSTDETSDAGAWLKLAIISKQYSTQTQNLVQQLISWRKNNPSHPGNALFPGNDVLARLLNVPPSHHIALLLPLTGPFSTQGKTVRDGFLSAYYASSDKNSQTLSFYDTNKNSSVPALYQQAMAEGADKIIGPLSKGNVQELLRQNHFAIPTLALNYTETGFGSLPVNFYEFGLSATDETQQIAQKAWQTGRSRALIIAPQNDWGQRIARSLISPWQSLGGKITDTWYFTPQTNLTEGIANLLRVDTQKDRLNMQDNNNRPFLEQQRRQDFDVIFLIAQPAAAREIVPSLKYYYADNVPIFAASAMYSGTPDPQKDSDLNGVYFCDVPFILQTHVVINNDDKRLYAVGLDTYLLSNALLRLSTLPNFPLYGATGALTLTSKQQIYRRLLWIQMHDGHP